jgi:hypothetical protein
MLTETRHLQPHSLEIAAGRRRRHPPLQGSEGGEGCKGSSHALTQEHRHGAKFNWLRAAHSRVKHYFRLGRTSPSTLPVAPIESRLEISRADGRTTFRLPHASPICAAGTLSLRLSSHNRLDVDELLIKGIRRDGSTFRPSDWAERLCGVAAILHSDAIALSREHYAARPCFDCSLLVRPAIICGVLCVIVDLGLRTLEPCAWNFVSGFARDNDLVTLEVLSSSRGD